MSRKRKPIVINLAKPAPGSLHFGPIVVEHIFNTYYVDRGVIKRRQRPLLTPLTWAEKVNYKKPIC